MHHNHALQMRVPRQQLPPSPRQKGPHRHGVALRRVCRLLVVDVVFDMVIVFMVIVVMIIFVFIVIIIVLSSQS